jgi:hypothetical protein
VIRYLDKQGKEITLLEFAQLIQVKDYWQIGLYERGGYRVSTVWLGPLNFGFEAQTNFETMVFAPDRVKVLRTSRYKTEEEAVDGHLDAVGWLESEVLSKETPDA